MGFPGGSDGEECLQCRWPQVRSLGREDSLEKRMAIHSSIPACRIPWTEEPGGLQLIGSQRVGHDWAANTSTFFHLDRAPLPSTQHFWSMIHSPWNMKWEDGWYGWLSKFQHKFGRYSISSQNLGDIKRSSATPRWPWKNGRWSEGGDERLWGKSK